MSILKDRLNSWREAMRPKPKEPKPDAPQEMETAGHSGYFITSVTAFAVACAAATEWYWAVLFCIEAVGRVMFHWDTAAGSAERGRNLWDFAFATNLPILIGLVCATVPIVLWSMVWLPTWFAARNTGRWRRITACATGLLCNFLIVVSGTVIMNGNRQEQVRAGLVQEQGRDAGIEALKSRRASAEEHLRQMTGPELGNKLQAQAARAGAAGWKATVEASCAARDPLCTARTSAIGSAVAADEYRKQIDDLTAQIAAAPTAAAVAVNVDDRNGAALNRFAQLVEVWRPPFVALTCTLIGIFGGWWLVGLYDKLAAGRTTISAMRKEAWADDEHMIADLREQEKPKAAPMDAGYHGDVIWDDQGAEMKWVEGFVNKRGKWVPGHYRKTGGKKKVVVVDEPAAISSGDERVGWDKVNDNGQSDEISADVDYADGARVTGAGVLEGRGTGEVSGGLAAGEVRTDASGDDFGADGAVGTASSAWDALIGEPQDLGVDYETPFGPPAPQVGLGADGTDGVMRPVAAE